MNTHNHRLMKYITRMEQLSDTIVTPNIIGEVDIIDLICFVISAVYMLFISKYTVQAFCLANHEHHQKRTRKKLNLYNLIFEDTDYQDMKTETARFVTPAICLISGLLLMLLFAPPRDEMLQFMDESGLINVYLLIISVLLSPVSPVDIERHSAEIEAMSLQSQLYQAQLKSINQQ